MTADKETSIVRPARMRACSSESETRTVRGASNRSAIRTLAERASKFTFLLHPPPDSHNAVRVQAGHLPQDSRSPGNPQEHPHLRPVASSRSTPESRLRLTCGGTSATCTARGSTGPTRTLTDLLRHCFLKQPESLPRGLPGRGR